MRTKFLSCGAIVTIPAGSTSHRPDIEAFYQIKADRRPLGNEQMWRQQHPQRNNLMTTGAAHRTRTTLRRKDKYSHIPRLYGLLLTKHFSRKNCCGHSTYTHHDGGLYCVAYSCSSISEQQWRWAVVRCLPDVACSNNVLGTKSTSAFAQLYAVLHRMISLYT